MVEKWNEPPWPHPFPTTVAKGDFLEPPVRTTSPAAIRRVPLSPSAASAAGGWGSLESRLVYRVGSCWSPVGGVGELAARPMRSFAAALFLSGDGSLRRSGVELRPSSCSQIFASVQRGFPSPASVERRRRWCVQVDRAEDWSHSVRLDGARWRLRGVRGLSTSRPHGDASDPRLKRGVAAARRQSGLLGVDDDGVQEGLSCIFLFVLDLSVMDCG